MEERLNEKVEESSLERLKRVAEELNKTGVEESRKENLNLKEDISTIEHPTLQKGEMNPVRGQRGVVETQREQTSNGVKIAGTILPDLIQEKMKLEKILQEMNNLKSKICQRIELIKTIERREKGLNQQLASARKEDDFPDQIEKGLENLKENIKF